MKKELMIFTLLLLSTFTVLAEEIIIQIEPNTDTLSTQEAKSMTELNNLNITHTFTSFNAVAIQVNQTQKEKLQKMNNVKILENRNFTITLDSSATQVNATNTWPLQTNTTNLTGLHQTVCVIDTGVNYSHINLGGCYGENNPNSSCTILGGYDFVNDDDDPMDDNGHGTHVTGIITSNHSTYKGIAPDTRIVALKVLNAAGSGNTADLISAIEWCTNNATRFNITVISMSLGDNTFHNSTCDADSVTSSAHAAIAQNITIVAATGNCISGEAYNASLCSTGISAPACISDVIPVGEVNDGDTIFYQRWPLWQIQAPGAAITSTSYSGEFTSSSGTSMSTPHVAAAAALLQQLNKLQKGVTLTNESTQEYLNKTNVRIDARSEGNGLFPRLNILEAIYSLDSVPPAITQFAPTNNSLSINTTQIFKINVTDINLQNITFYLSNSTSIVNTTTFQLSGQNTSIELTFYNLTEEETYTWYTTSYDKQNNAKADNYTITISGINIQTNTTNNTYTNQNLSNFTCNASTVSTATLTNTTFTLYNETSQIYQETKNITGTSNTTTFNYTFTTNGIYKFNCITKNNISESSNTSNKTITFDTSKPRIALQTPFPTSTTSNSVTKTFFFNVTDERTNYTTCSLIINGAVNNQSNITTFNTTVNLKKTLTPSSYSWYINCTDQANNTNSSTTKSFTISTPATSSSSGGGGGGGGGTTPSTESNSNTTPEISSKKLENGTSTKLSTNQNTTFQFTNQETHTITLNTITNNTAQFTIQSDPITTILSVGETQKINLSSPQTLNLQITLNTLNATTANITLKEINEPNPNYKAPNLTEERFHATNQTQTPEEQQTTSVQTYILTILIILLIIQAATHFYLKHKETKDINTKTPTQEEDETPEETN